MTPPRSGHDRDAALLFALIGERLSCHYAHAAWPSDGQMRQVAQDWLQRARLRVAAPRLRDLVAASGELARQVAGGLSREAGLYLTHELQESLDPNHRSDVAQAIMDQCVAWAAAASDPAIPDLPEDA